MTKFRTPWIDITVQVCFEETQMEIVRSGHDGPREKRDIVTPVFRLSDGTEFTGRRLGKELRAKLVQAGRPKGLRT